MTTKKLTRRQARWAEFLANYNFQVTYQSGKKNEKADSLTRRPGDQPVDDSDERQKHQLRTILPPSCLGQGTHLSDRAGVYIAENEVDYKELPQENFFNYIKTQQRDDEFCQEVLGMLRTGQKHSKKISLQHYKDKENALYFRDKL